MKRTDLAQYKDLKVAIARKRKKLNEARAKRNIEVDTVTGSSNHFPYEKRVIPIKGQVKSAREQRIALELERMLQKEEKEMQDIIRWIEDIPDCRTREVFFMHYVEGKTFEQIGRELFIAESTARYWIHDRYIEKNCL